MKTSSLRKYIYKNIYALWLGLKPCFQSCWFMIKNNFILVGFLLKKQEISISHLLYPFHMDLQIKILQMSLFVYKYFSCSANTEI